MTSPGMTSTLIFVDGVPYLITERVEDAFRARALTTVEKKLMFRMLNDCHAEIEAHLKGYDG